MIYDPLFQAIVFGTLIAFGFACDRAYLTWRDKRRKRSRRASLGMNYRKEPEPYWGRAADLKGLRR